MKDILNIAVIYSNGESVFVEQVKVEQSNQLNLEVVRRLKFLVAGGVSAFFHRAVYNAVIDSDINLVCLFDDAEKQIVNEELYEFAQAMSGINIWGASLGTKNSAINCVVSDYFRGEVPACIAVDKAKPIDAKEHRKWELDLLGPDPVKTMLKAERGTEAWAYSQIRRVGGVPTMDACHSLIQHYRECQG